MSAFGQCKLGEIDKIESIQRKAIRIPIDFEKLENEEILKILCLTSLKDKRLRDDLNEKQKMMSSRESMNWV